MTEEEQNVFEELFFRVRLFVSTYTILSVRFSGRCGIPYNTVYMITRTAEQEIRFI